MLFPKWTGKNLGALLWGSLNLVELTWVAALVERFEPAEARGTRARCSQTNLQFLWSLVSWACQRPPSPCEVLYILRRAGQRV